MGNCLHLTYHRGNAVTVFRVISQIWVEIINPGIGVILRIIDHQFIHIRADLLDGDALFDDIRQITLYGDNACRRPPHNDLHFPVLDIQLCLYQDAVFLHCRDDHGINEIHDVVMPALVGWRDMQAPILCGGNRADRKPFDVLHPILIGGEHFFYPVTDKLLHAPLPLQIHIEKHIRIQQLHERFIRNGL